MSLSDYKNIISTLATIVTIIQFLSGIEICHKIMKQGSSGDISGFPFVGGAFSTSAWLIFSYIIRDTPMMITNSVGFCLQVIYLLVYIHFCVAVGPWKTFRRQMLLFVILSGSLIYYSFFSGQDTEVLKTHVGLICCFASIIFCASPLVSIRDVLRMKSTEILPFPLILSMFFVGGLWALYGIIIENSFVAYPNILVFLIATFQLSLFAVYPGKRKDYQHVITD